MVFESENYNLQFRRRLGSVLILQGFNMALTYPVARFVGANNTFTGYQSWTLALWSLYSLMPLMILCGPVLVYGLAILLGRKYSHSTLLELVELGILASSAFYLITAMEIINMVQDYLMLLSASVQLVLTLISLNYLNSWIRKLLIVTKLKHYPKRGVELILHSS